MNINRGKFVLVNETSGNVCSVSIRRGRYVASRSTCYRVRQTLSREFPECVYAVYELVRRGG